MLNYEQVAEVIAPFHTSLPVDLPHTFHHTHTAQAFPLFPVGIPNDLFGLPVTPLFQPAMTLFHRFQENHSFVPRLTASSKKLFTSAKAVP